MAKAGTVRAGNGLLPEKFLGGTKRMKKIIALLLALVMVFALVACSSKTTDDTAKDVHRLFVEVVIKRRFIRWNNFQSIL